MVKVRVRKSQRGVKFKGKGVVGEVQGGKSLREEKSDEGKFQEEGNSEGGKSEGKNYEKVKVRKSNSPRRRGK